MTRKNVLFHQNEKSSATQYPITMEVFMTTDGEVKTPVLLIDLIAGVVVAAVFLWVLFMEPVQTWLSQSLFGTLIMLFAPILVLPAAILAARKSRVKKPSTNVAQHNE